MVTNIDHTEVQHLIKEGAQLVEVLPEEEFAEDHLIGAINIPLTKINAETITARVLAGVFRLKERTRW